MLIADNFIMLHLPKTASTFARKAIKKAYGMTHISLLDRLLFSSGLKEETIKELLLPNIKIDFRSAKDQHGVYDQIPEKYLNDGRELVSIIRDPFAAYVSRYTFESWKRNTPHSLEKVQIEFPNFPNLSFSEYLEFCVKINLPHRLQGISLKKGARLGILSVQFIQMFCKNHKKVLSTIDKNYKDNGLYEKHFPKITFLRTENINDELFDFLKKRSFSKKEIQFIKDAKKVNVSNRKPYQAYLDKATVKKILDLEWLLFDLFPEYKPENNNQLNNFF